MGRAGNEFGGPARERSGWLIPLAVFLVTAVLTGLVLLYYLSPTPSELIEEQAAPTDSTTPVALNVGSRHFHIPANYIPYASARKGGALTELKLQALLPDLQGYSTGDAQEFNSDAADSRVVKLRIRAEPTTLPESDRLNRVYLPQVANRDGAAGSDGLTHYTFRPDTGYRNKDLFLGQTDKGPMALLCEQPAEDVVAPICRRDMLLAPGVALNYFFKRTHLANWREIDTGVRALIASFMDK